MNSNLTLSSWNTSHDTDITVTLSGIQLETCYWNILDINLQILKSFLQDTTLQISGKTENEPSSVIYSNSKIKHLIGSTIELKVVRTFMTNVGDSSNALFKVHDSKISIINSTFSNIDAEGTDATAVLEAWRSQVEIHHSTFLNNSAPWSNINGFKSNILVKSSFFYKNQALYGGCIFAEMSNVSLIETVFESNQASFDIMFEGSILGRKTSNVSHTNSELEQNNATEEGTFDIKQSTVMMPGGGAINVQHFSSMMILSSIFKGNNASHPAYGGSILAANKTSITIENSSFVENQAKKGGSIYVTKNVSLAIDKCTFTQNKAIGSEFMNGIRVMTVFGGAISGDNDVKINVFQSRFLGNYAEDGNGAAIYLEKNIHLAIHSCLFEGNAGTIWSGAIEVQYGVHVTIKNTNFINNTGKLGSGGLAVRRFSNRTSILLIYSCLFENNVSPRGGAIYAETSWYMIVKNTTFRSNTGGGAIYALNVVTVNIQNSFFDGNLAYQEKGGAIFMKNNREKVTFNTSITDTIFTNNQAVEGGGIYAVNGGIFVTVNTFIASCYFENNMAAIGSAVSIDMVQLFVGNTTFFNNSAVTVNEYGLRNNVLEDLYGYRPGKDIAYGATLNGFSSDIVILSSHFIRNKGDGDHGIISHSAKVFQGTLFIKDSLFYGNTVEAGKVIGGITSTFSMMNTEILYNKAHHIITMNFLKNYIKYFSNQVTMTNCSVKHNTVLHDKGSGIRVINSQLNITESEFINNTLQGTGTIFVAYSHVYITRSHFVHNMAHEGSCLAISDNSTMDVLDTIFSQVSLGAIHVYGTSKLTLFNCLMVDNSLKYMYPKNSLNDD